MVESFISCHPEMTSLFIFLRCFLIDIFIFTHSKDESVYKIKVFTNVFTLQFRTARRQVSIPLHFYKYVYKSSSPPPPCQCRHFYKSQKCLSALLVENCLLNISIFSTPLVIFNVFHETHTLRVVSHSASPEAFPSYRKSFIFFLPLFAFSPHISVSQPPASQKKKFPCALVWPGLRVHTFYANRSADEL